MDYLSPTEVTAAMVESGAKKARLGVSDLLIRGALSGAILGFSESLSAAVTVATGNAVVGAVLFPIGFIMIVLLNLELFTGACALLPVAAFAGRASGGQVLRNWVFVYLGNLIGALVYAFLFAAVSTRFFTGAPDAVGAKMIAIAVAKTSPYMQAGGAGWATALVKGMLCNWMVALGTVMGMVSRSVVGKAVAAWMPIMAFVAMGFEHCVVNMFAVPVGIMLGGPVTWGNWLMWNQIPVTLGNIIGGLILTGAALYVTFKPSLTTAAPGAVPVAAE
jgi:formate transporter